MAVSIFSALKDSTTCELVHTSVSRILVHMNSFIQVYPVEVSTVRQTPLPILTSHTALLTPVNCCTSSHFRSQLRAKSARVLYRQQSGTDPISFHRPPCASSSPYNAEFARSRGRIIMKSSVCGRLQKVGVIVDSITVGNEKNDQLKCLSLATGGYAFHPMTLRAALRLNELETVLLAGQRARQRPAANARRVSSKYELVTAARLGAPHDTEETATLKEDHGARASEDCGGDGGAVHPERQRRVQREMMDWMKNPHQAFEVFPSDENMHFWKVLVNGPASTPQQGRVLDAQHVRPSGLPLRGSQGPLHHAHPPLQHQLPRKGVPRPIRPVMDPQHDGSGRPVVCVRAALGSGPRRPARLYLGSPDVRLQRPVRGRASTSRLTPASRARCGRRRWRLRACLRGSDCREAS
ncbi:unnamed protein product [Ectocarpus sp. 12 AP-2014]